MTNELQTARYDNLVRRLGGLLGPGSKVTETLSELFPVVETENLPAELLFLGGWIIGMNTATPGPVVGEFAHAQVFNPLGSGKIAVVTDLHVTGSAQQIDWQINELAISALATGITRDTHAGMDTGTAVGTGASTSITRTPSAGMFNMGSNVTFHLHFENSICVLAPGSGLEIGGTVMNSSLRATFIWRERVALPSELNFP